MPRRHPYDLDLGPLEPESFFAVRPRAQRRNVLAEPARLGDDPVRERVAIAARIVVGRRPHSVLPAVALDRPHGLRFDDVEPGDPGACAHDLPAVV